MTPEGTVIAAENSLLGFSKSQQERLFYIEFRLCFLGEIKRSDLMERFGIAAAAATRDFALYKQLAPHNIDFEGSTKSYIYKDSFSPLFEQKSERVLTALSRGFGDGISSANGPLILCDRPLSLNLPVMSTLATVTRAINRKKSLKIVYFSVTGGESVREIVPFALVNSGLRWHTRAFDRKSQEFRDFVITRIEDPLILEKDLIAKHERQDEDIQWNRIVELHLVPHPSNSKLEVIKRDYQIGNDGLRLNIRAANAGYTLRLWHIDCSPDHSLKGPEYQLWLKDPLALYGVKNALLAPGYKNPEPS